MFTVLNKKLNVLQSKNLPQANDHKSFFNQNIGVTPKKGVSITFATQSIRSKINCNGIANNIDCDLSILPKVKFNNLTLIIHQDKYLENSKLLHGENQAGTFLRSENVRILKKNWPKPIFSKSDQVLEDKIRFSDDKNRKWFTFLPFETPNLLFLPKMGIVLFYSSSFSIINSF